MKVQVIKGSKGEDAGVFIPMSDWQIIKENYPYIEETENDLPDWEKSLIDERLEKIHNHPERIKEGKILLEALRS